ncbi:MAG: DUF4136 domain-containing protein [Sphingomonadales bacterium]|nr:DUF4136 domain-containing protein [Sphingomonadales bacterium]
MSVQFRTMARGLKLALAPVALLGLSACAQNFNADVSRYATQLPAPAGQSFAVVADDPALAGGLEFSQYARLVEARMAQLGYQPAANPETATLLVRFDYGVDKGRERVRSAPMTYDPFWSPWYGYGRMGYWGGPGYFGRGGYYGRGGFYGHGMWGYGWNDPWFDNGYENYPVYTSGIELKIDRRADGQRLFEGKAEAASTSNRLPYLVPNLVEAMFTDFPGHNGETVRISVAPEKQRK